MVCFYVIISENFKRFQSFNFKKIFWKTKNFLKKLEYHFSVETIKIENTSFKATLSEANVKSNKMAVTKWIYHKDWSFISINF